jgi:predicted PurR-regulated permease PerM
VTAGGVRRPAGLTPRTVLMVIGLVIAVAAAIVLIWLSRRIITWLLIAAFLAVALNPAVDMLNRRLRMRRSLAITVVFILGLGAATGIALVFVPPLIDAGQQLVDDAPGYIDQLRRTEVFRDLDERYALLERIQEGVQQLPERLGGAGAAVDIVQRLFAGIIGTLTVLVLTFFLLVYGKQLRDQGIAALPEGQRARYLDVTDRMYKAVGGYVAGNLLVSVVAGVAAYIALLVIGVPAALALAAWVALTDLLPLVGATIGAIPAVVVAFFQGWPTGVAVAAYFLVYQQVENHAVQPVVMRRTTNLNPLIVLVAVLLGAELLGVLGALIAIPVAGMIQILVQDQIDHRWPRGRQHVDLEPSEPA